MPERQGNTRASGRRESRRRFFQLLAGSPLLAAAYPALRPAWQEAVAWESSNGVTVDQDQQGFSVQIAVRRWSSRPPPTPVPTPRRPALSHWTATGSSKGNSRAKLSILPNKRSMCGTWR